MEQIFKSLLKKQGYEYIGIINSDEKIWGFEKDGIFHFCKEDLTETDRHAIGFDSGVIVLTLDGDNIIQVDECYRFHTYRVIDNLNHVIASKDDELLDKISGNKTSFCLKKINNQSIIIITRWDKYVCKVSDKALYDTSLVKDPIRTIEWDFQQVVIINGRLAPELNIYMYLNDYYFFKIYNELSCEYRKIYHEEDFVYEGRTPYVWLHDNGKFHLICFCGEYDDGYSSFDVIDLENIGFPKHYDVTKYAGKDNIRFDDANNNLFSNNHLIFPFSDRSGSLVLQYYQRISAYCIHYESNNGITTMFNGKLIKVVFQHPISSYTEIDYYDLNGNHLEIPYKADFVTPFAIRNKCLFNKAEKLYGVIDLRSNEILLPPIFDSVKDLDYNDDGWTFEVNYYNIIDNKGQIIRGLYSSKKGFVSLEKY